MIKVHNLNVWKSGLEIVRGLSFEVGKGESLAILGSNGSGKSAILSALCEPISDSDGDVYINHFKKHPEDINYRHRLGYLPCPFSIDSKISGYEFLEIVALFYHLGPSFRQDIKNLSEYFEITKSLYYPSTQLSPSAERKIGLIGSLFHKPNVLILDEPFIHLDTRSSHKLNKILQKFLKDGGSLLFSSNDLDQVERLADSAIILGSTDLTKQPISRLTRRQTLKDTFLELTSNDQ